MHTPSHIIFNLAFLWGKKKQQFHIPIFLWALLPDVSMFFFVLIEKVRWYPMEVIFEERYYLPYWQALFDIWHSFPVIALFFWIAMYLKRDWWKYLFSSMWVHSLFDLPLHHDDTHRHFWPISDFRFYSPVSYWDPAHYGHIFAWIEAVMVLILSVYLMRTLKYTYSKVLVWVLSILIVWGFLFFFFWF